MLLARTCCLRARPSVVCVCGQSGSGADGRRHRGRRASSMFDLCGGYGDGNCWLAVKTFARRLMPLSAGEPIVSLVAHLRGRRSLSSREKVNLPPPAIGFVAHQLGKTHQPMLGSLKKECALQVAFCVLDGGDNNRAEQLDNNERATAIMRHDRGETNLQLAERRQQQLSRRLLGPSAKCRPRE